MIEPALPKEAAERNSVLFKEAKKNHGLWSVWETSAVNVNRHFNE